MMRSSVMRDYRRILLLPPLSQRKGRGGLGRFALEDNPPLPNSPLRLWRKGWAITIRVS